MALAALVFPATATAPLAQSPHVPAGIALRAACAADSGFLRELYGELRADELAGVPWPAPLKQTFLDSQFALQHRHYTTQFPAADFLIVERAGGAVGRLYLDRRDAEWRLIDIGLLASARGSGLGTALLRHALALAGARGAGLALHVQRDNTRARALYERLGFCAGALDGLHQAMRWTPNVEVS